MGRTNRRDFMKSTFAAGAAAALSGAAFGEPAKYRVAVIGRTGRGDYGHGLDEVWNEVEQAKVVAVADDNDLVTVVIQLASDSLDAFYEHACGVDNIEAFFFYPGNLVR